VFKLCYFMLIPYTITVGCVNFGLDIILHIITMSNLTPSRSAANKSHRQTFWSPCIILLARVLELTLLSFVDAWVDISASTSTVGVISISLELILFTALADTLSDSRTLTNNPPLPLLDNLVPSVHSPFVSC
jgi:hypothetical protein